MNRITRRAVTQHATIVFFLLFNAAPMLTELTFAGEPAVGRNPVPMIHVTDLYRPHNDPDDHWDLACVYALAWRGDVNLLGVLIDYPQAGRDHDPDVLAVAQMNYLTGQTVPVAVGAPKWLDSHEFSQATNEPGLRGIRAMLQLLRRSPDPVVINVLGSCRDVAIAGRLEPELFAEKCAAVYLNAGSGTPDPAKAAQLEWNVHLDPRGYAAIFELPCPVYWMPCFEEVGRKPQQPFQAAEYGTFYRFHQGDILPQLSDGVQNFFAYMFLHGRAGQVDVESLRPDWLRSLGGEQDQELMARIQAMDRNMWCTGGFLHAVGKTVTASGETVALAEASDPIFTFDPIRVRCSPNGVTEWQAGKTAPPRFIFHVQDHQQYAAAMTSALGSLLGDLP